jgi:hypothetical protein
MFEDRTGDLLGHGLVPKTERQSKARNAIESRKRAVREAKLDRHFNTLRWKQLVEFVEWRRSIRIHQSRLDAWMGLQHRKPRHVSLQETKYEWHG